MDLISQLSVLDTVLISGIVWLSGVFFWFLKKFVSSYDKNTTVMAEIGKMLIAIDNKMDTASDVDRQILVELARLGNPKRLL